MGTWGLEVRCVLWFLSRLLYYVNFGVNILFWYNGWFIFKVIEGMSFSLKFFFSYSIVWFWVFLEKGRFYMEERLEKGLGWRKVYLWVILLFWVFGVYGWFCIYGSWRWVGG